MDHKELASKLSYIHRSVFGNFEYKTDKEKHGKPEKWEMIPESFTPNSKLVGDCEEFAMACRKLCRDENIESRLVVCWTEEDEGHLVVECDGYVLDNRYPKLMTKDSLEREGYRWYAISGFNSGDPWLKIKN